MFEMQPCLTVKLSLCFVFILPFSKAFGELRELTCNMTEYSQSGYNSDKSRKVELSWIPEETVHFVDFPGIRLITWGYVFGTAEYGDTLKQNYSFENTLNTVTYTCFPNTDVVIGRADFNGFNTIKAVKGNAGRLGKD